MGHVPEEDNRNDESSVIEDNYGQNENESSSNDFNPTKMNQESLKRQKVVSDNNMADSLLRNKGLFEAKQSHQQLQGDNDQQMQDQLKFIKDMVAKAEIGAKDNQNSNLNAGPNGRENLEVTGPVDAYRNLPRESVQKNDLIQQRNKMIFDEDTGSEGLGASQHQNSLPAEKSAPG